MQNVLYLKDDERKAFDKLSADLKEGWRVEAETIVFKDDDKNRQVRLEIMQISDPTLLAFRKKAQNAKDAKEFLTLVDELDLATVDEQDIGQLFFGLGPDAVTALMAAMLPDVQTDDDMQHFAAFSQLRHIILESLTSK